MAVNKVILADGTVRWRLRFLESRDPETGKRRFVNRTYDRKRDADNEEARLRGLRESGQPLRISKEPFGKYLKTWLSKAKQHSLRARTYADYTSILDRYIQNPKGDSPNLGTIPIGRLSAHAIEELYHHLLEVEGLSPSTIRRIHAVIRQGLQRALQRREVGSNQADLVDLPQQSKRKVTAFEPEEAQAFLAAAREDRYYPLWCILLTGGLRPGEALALAWPNVDFDGGKVRVERALTRRGLDRERHPKGWALVEPKTDNARRTVPLPGFTMRALKEWKAKQAEARLLMGPEWEDNDLVFTNDFGRPLDGANLYDRNFRRIMAAAGIGEWETDEEGKRKRFVPRYRLYDLRHSCSTALLAQGVNIKAISERLGHASTAFTMDVYSAHLPDMQEEAASKLEALWGTGN